MPSGGAGERFRLSPPGAMGGTGGPYSDKVMTSALPLFVSTPQGPHGSTTDVLAAALLHSTICSKAGDDKATFHL